MWGRSCGIGFESGTYGKKIFRLLYKFIMALFASTFIYIYHNSDTII